MGGIVEKFRNLQSKRWECGEAYLCSGEPNIYGMGNCNLLRFC